jgi:c(7)-type cytochrome triheme protein
VAAFLVIGLLCLLPTSSSASVAFRLPTETQSRAQSRRRPAARKPAPKSYASFSHTTHVTTQKLACDSCHKVPTSNWKEVRKGDATFPDVAEFPQHSTCLNCHRSQFFARERPAPSICSNCHVAVTPRDTTRWAFPSLGEAFLTTARAESFVSEFRVAFPHAKHEDAASCDDCHKTYQPQGKSDDEFLNKPPKDMGDAFWLKKGTFKTRPLTHASCFTCHNQESEVAPLPKNCDACHKLGASESRATDFDIALARKIGVNDWWTKTAWAHRVSSGAFRHEVHPDLKCAQCHQVASVENTLTKLHVPVKSCGGAEGCHITATADDGGILNYEIDQRNKNANFVCTKCHLVFGNKPVPASHVSAIPKAAAALVRFEKVVFAHAQPADGAFEAPPTDYSQFKHDNPKHARLPCLLCHRRENNLAQPTLPGKAQHAPCTGCHQQQFADKSNTICTICHTDVQSGRVKAFPPLRSFNAKFDHAAHTTSGAACATCHRRSRGGVALSIPDRLNAHVTCFACHTPDAKANGRDISSCSTCHQLGRLVRTSEQAAAYRVGFSHANHDASEKLACAGCHRVRAGVAQGRQVSSPLPLNHHAPAGATSCASCHNGARAFGGDDFSTCTRCHKGPNWKF